MLQPAGIHATANYFLKGEWSRRGALFVLFFVLKKICPPVMYSSASKEKKKILQTNWPNKNTFCGLQMSDVGLQRANKQHY